MLLKKYLENIEIQKLCRWGFNFFGPPYSEKKAENFLCLKSFKVKLKIRLRLHFHRRHLRLVQ